MAKRSSGGGGGRGARGGGAAAAAGAPPATFTSTGAPGESIPTDPSKLPPGSGERKGADVPPPDTTEIFRKADGKLTRAGAERVIREGGSVMLAGKTYSRAEDLPTESEFAEGDEASVAELERELDRREASIAAERARLRSSRRGK